MSIKERYLEAYVHNGRIGVLVELSTDSQIMIQTAAFKELARDIALHVAAANPEDGAALLSQPFAKDPQMSVEQRIARTSQELRESMSVTRFVRWDTELKGPTSSGPRPDPAFAVRLRVVK